MYQCMNGRVGDTRNGINTAFGLSLAVINVYSLCYAQLGVYTSR